MSKAVFVDRDGVITDLRNYSSGDNLDYLTKKEDIRFFDRTAEAIKLLNRENIKVIIVTNQPQIAKGLITEQDTVSINDEIIKRLANDGARIDAVYYCPHHPNGIIEKYSIECDCRKPLPGLLLRAGKERDINLRESYMIGDRISDIKAGNLAGCRKTIGVRTGYACNDGFKDAVPDVLVSDFYEAAREITKKKLKLFINAGGEGKRLQSFIKETPKPMISIKGKPLLHHLVEWAKKSSVDEIIMMLGYKSEKIIEYFKDGSEFGIPIKYSIEPYPLGSGGSLRYAMNHIDGTFVYINGDLICEVDFEKMLEFHKKNNSDMTLFLHKSSHPLDSDILQIDENKNVTRFVSKHENHDGAGDLSNAGLCILEPKVVELMEQEIFNFENYLYPKALEKGFNVMGYVSDERIYDVGTRERLKTIIESDFKNKMNILVTGAGGMMGSHMLDFLVAKGHNVLGVDFIPTTDARELNKQALYIECDIRDKDKLINIINKFKPDMIFHLAAQSFPTVSWDRPEYTIQTNILGTVNLFEAVKELKLNTIVLNAGSSAEYGYVDAKDIPVKEDRELKPLHPYGISKVAQELLAYQYHKNFGIKSVTIRIFNTTGPRKINDVCSDFTKQIVLMEKGFQEPILKVGNITTKRAITDVRDMIEAFWLAVNKCDFGDRYNVSGEKLYLIKDIIEILRELTNINFEMQEDPKLIRPTDEPVIYGDSTRFKEKTGWSQKIDIKTTLKDMLDYWRKKL